MAKKWFATVTYKTELCGDLDVDVSYDSKAELDDFIANGWGIEAVVMIVSKPNPACMPPSTAIEKLIRRLEIIDDLKYASLDGASSEDERWLQDEPQIEGNHANAQTDDRIFPPLRRCA